MSEEPLDYPAYLLRPGDSFSERKIGRSHSLLEFFGDRNRHPPICGKVSEGQIEEN